MVLLLIAFIGCTSSSKKLGNKGVPTTVFGLLPHAEEGKKIETEETPPRQGTEL
jgi:hypothetical protein